MDQNTGFTKFGQRYYNPALGAFSEQDTFARLASPGNGNLYAYGGDDPVNYTDPTGALSLSGVIGIAVGIVIGLAGIAGCPETAGTGCAVAVVFVGAAVGAAIDQWGPSGEVPNPVPDWEQQLWTATCAFGTDPQCYGIPFP